MNVKLLRKIAAVIQERPRQFKMKSWHKAKGMQYGVDSLCELAPEKREACGTTHCIAGWAQVISPDRDCKRDAEDDARRLLELDWQQSQLLFYADSWPRGYGGWGATPEQAAARIELFISSGGTE